MGKYALMVFTNPVAGREDEFNTWYTQRHLADIIAIPGYRSAQRFKRQIPVMGESKHAYLAIYEMDAETPAEVDAAVEALGATEMEISEALDVEGVLHGVFEVGSGLGVPSGAFRLVAASDAVEGREADYNRWYDDIHLGEVTAVEGISGAQRYKLAKTLREPFANRYLAIYGIEGDSVADAGGALKRMGGAKLQLTDAMRNAGGEMAIYEVISEKIERPEAVNA